MNTLAADSKRLGTFFSEVPRVVLGWFGFGTNVGSICTINFLLIGLPLWTIFHYGFITATDFSKTDLALAVSIYISGIWIWLGPLLISFWEIKFFKFAEVLMSNSKDAAATGKFLRFYRRWAWLFGMLYASVAFFFFYIALPYIEPLMDIHRADVYPFVLIVLFVSAFACGYGVSGLVQTIIIFSKLDSFRIEWNPFHSDRRGGYGFLVNFGVMTAVFFACGSFVIPAAFQIARMIDNRAIWLIHLLIGLYTAQIVFAFAYPAMRTFLKAGREKKSELRTIAVRLAKLYQPIKTWVGGISSKDIALRLAYFHHLKSVEDRVESVSAAPFPLAVALSSGLPYAFTVLTKILEMLFPTTG